MCAYFKLFWQEKLQTVETSFQATFILKEEEDRASRVNVEQPTAESGEKVQQPNLTNKIKLKTGEVN